MVLLALEIVWFTFAGRVAGVLTFDEVPFLVGRTAVMLLALEIVWFTFAGRVAGVLTFDEVPFLVGRTAVMLLALEVVWSTFAGTAGRVAGLSTFGKVAFGMRTWWAMMLFFIVFTVMTASGVARPLPGDQGTGIALGGG